MAWFDGTYTVNREDLENAYPVRITEDLRRERTKGPWDCGKLALINHFREGDPLLDLSDPHVNEDEYGKTVFYHVFAGDDAEKARTAVTEYFESHGDLFPDNLVLLRQEGERLFQYACGHICHPLLDRQDELRKLLPEGFDTRQDVFLLPLKRYMYSCPVCWERTLPSRGDFIICPECGWEDDGTDRIDEITLPNGDYTIRSYRKKYLKMRGKA